MLKKLSLVLLVLLILLAYRLLFGDANLLQLARLKKTLAAQNAELAILRDRNKDIAKKINNIKSSPEAIEEQARYELGMVKAGEKYYQVIEPIQ
jgi:cell division protein FtsB